MIVIGVDAHKRTHTLVALDAATGTSWGETMIQASEDGVLNALRFAAGLDHERVWAVEDCRHLKSGPDRCPRKRNPELHSREVACDQAMLVSPRLGP